MKTLRMLETAVTLLFRAVVGIAFLVLIAAVLVQVVGRLSGASPVWTEELTRFALLYLAAVGAGLSLKSGELVNVDVVCEAFPERIAWTLRLVSALLVAGLGLYLLPMAWRFTTIGNFQTSPALGLKMSYVHFTVFLMLALLAFFAILRVVGMLTGTDNGRPAHLNIDPEE
ncbi:TRAP-type C4-dicarboxylate transport system, small permease component [Tranquillimonas rosea]|uniref:TRAP transporter small permease protein n=1 Tax=Tranquillimonas rosea TaxID=641238 RepID=A0A1H9U9S6_9RHOB|nr:TRAP transporter small permease [Tranquillimonas rosea]SES06206.1 TRAP-type C4-dicarboxylate transport system, small permease component [Tranquillimonas rosea]